MVEVITRKDIEKNTQFYLEEVKEGKIFIYPTDTIYGIGCHANFPFSITKIRELKKRENKPFSIIAPSKQWIYTTCNVTKNEEEWLEKLPGPYTFILKVNNEEELALKEITGGREAIGVRIPHNWFSTFISKSNVPFITTSVNISGEPHATSINTIPNSIQNNVDYIIDDGELSGNPSTVIDLTNNEKVLR